MAIEDYAWYDIWDYESERDGDVKERSVRRCQCGGILKDLKVHNGWVWWRCEDCERRVNALLSYKKASVAE